MIVLDDQTCPVGMVRNLEALLRAGIVRLVHAVLERARLGRADLCGRWRKGAGSPAISTSWRLTHELLAPGHTFCALAPGAVEPLQSALKYFRDDFERHIREHRCPWS